MFLFMLYKRKYGLNPKDSFRSKFYGGFAPDIRIDFICFSFHLKNLYKYRLINRGMYLQPLILQSRQINISYSSITQYIVFNRILAATPLSKGTFDLSTWILQNRPEALYICLFNINQGCDFLGSSILKLNFSAIYSLFPYKYILIVLL